MGFNKDDMDLGKEAVKKCEFGGRFIQADTKIKQSPTRKLDSHN